MDPAHDNFSCKICFEIYNSTKNKPELLVPCGHAFCNACISRFERPECPVCKVSFCKKLVVWDLIPSEEPDITQEIDPELVAVKNELMSLKSELNYTTSIIDLNCKLNMQRLNNAEKAITRQSEKLINRIIGEKNLLLERIKCGKNNLKSFDSWARFKMACVESSYDLISLRTQFYRTLAMGRPLTKEKSPEQLSKQIRQEISELKRLKESFEGLSSSIDAYQPTAHKIDECFLGQVNDDYIRHLDRIHYDLLSASKRSIQVDVSSVPVMRAGVPPSQATFTSSNHPPGRTDVSAQVNQELLQTRRILKPVRRVNTVADVGPRSRFDNIIVEL